MDLLRDIFLGLVQGVTGFLPVSSSGHLLLFSNWFGMDAGYTTFFLCVLKISSLLAIVVVMFKDIMRLIMGAFQLIVDMFANVIIFFKKNFGREKEGYYVLDTNPYKKMSLMILVSMIATGACGLFLKSVADNMAFIPLAIGICFIITGVVLALAESLSGDGKRNIKNMGVFEAFVIGIAQGISVIPGISRVAMVYVTAIAFGYSRSFAMKYTIFMAIPSAVGATLVNLCQLEGTSISISGLSNMLAGMLVCVSTSVLFLKIVLKLSKKGNFLVFALYGGAVGVITSIIGFFV